MATSTTGPASGLDIVAYRGDTFERWIRVKRNSVEEDLQPSTFRMQIRNGNQVVRELSTGASTGILIDSADGGVLALTLSATVMEEMPVGSFIYDMQQTYPNGKVKTRFRGTFQITDDVTKPIS